MGIIIAVLLFSFIIIFHELGHFLLAKKNGIRVDEFSLGLGTYVIRKTDRRDKIFSETASFRRRVYDGRR